MVLAGAILLSTARLWLGSASQCLSVISVQYTLLETNQSCRLPASCERAAELANSGFAYVPQRLGVLGAHVLDIILIEVTLSVCTLDVLAVVEPLEVAEPAVPVAPSGVVPLICTV